MVNYGPYVMYSGLGEELKFKEDVVVSKWAMCKLFSEQRQLLEKNGKQLLNVRRFQLIHKLYSSSVSGNNVSKAEARTIEIKKVLLYFHPGAYNSAIPLADLELVAKVSGGGRFIHQLYLKDYLDTWAVRYL